MPSKKKSFFVLLQLLAVFKTIPEFWWFNLSDFDEERNKKFFYNNLYNAHTFGYIQKKNQITGQEVIYLSEKGYNEVLKYHSIIWKYQRYSDKSNRRNLELSNHQYLIFLAFYRLFKDETKGLFLTDFDKKECRLTFDTYGKKSTIKPDGMIKTEEDTLILIEADMSTESIKHIFDKLLKYIMYVKQEGGRDGYESYKIYFTCKSQKRAFNLGSSEGYLIKHFMDTSFLRSKESKIKERISVTNLKPILEKGIIHFYFGDYTQPIEEYIELDILNHLGRSTKEENYLL